MRPVGVVGESVKSPDRCIARTLRQPSRCETGDTLAFLTIMPFGVLVGALDSICALVVCREKIREQWVFFPR